MLRKIQIARCDIVAGTLEDVCQSLELSCVFLRLPETQASGLVGGEDT